MNNTIVQQLPPLQFLSHYKCLSTNEEILYGNKKQKGQSRPFCDPHQRHLTKVTKAEILKKLGGKSKLHSIPANITDFESLYSHINQLIGSIKGVGPLTIYDVSLRLGVINNILPQHFVYLHAAPLSSAKKLHKIGQITLPHPCTPKVSISVFRTFAPGLSAYEIEHLLCVKHQAIHKLNSNSNRTLQSIP